jgi:eukaryotic-like serine/threonine-protein kinase
MIAPELPRIRPGSSIGSNLTVLHRLNGRGDDPVLLVWDHAGWCPIVCKMFRSKRRAHREATALSSLEHPNIVRCFGVHEPVYVLMEYLRGPRLSEFIQNRPAGRLSVSDSIRVAIHLGAALEHIHGKGFLHLDVKPDNVVIVHGRPVLFDFGSLRVRTAERPQQVHGTDPYIAPEELLLEHADASADVFSLGVTLYEMLTGELPFPQTRKRGAGQLTRGPDPLKLHRPQVSRRLEDLVLQCLARDPWARPALGTLLPALHGEISSGPPMWPRTLQNSRVWAARANSAVPGTSARPRLLEAVSGR